MTGVVGPIAYQIKPPDAYSGIHTVINVTYLGPYFPDPDQEFKPDLPPTDLHPTFNPLVQILDSRRHGRMPCDLQLHLDIPAQYLVIRTDGATVLQPQSELQAPQERQMIKKFVMKFPCSDAKPCEPVSTYIAKELLKLNWTLMMKLICYSLENWTNILAIIQSLRTEDAFPVS